MTKAVAWEDYGLCWCGKPAKYAVLFGRNQNTYRYCEKHFEEICTCGRFDVEFIRRGKEVREA